MRQVITAKEIEELLRQGASVPADAILTPSARDLLSDHAKRSRRQAQSAPRSAGSQAKDPSVTQIKSSPPSPREGFRECELSDTNETRSGVVCPPQRTGQTAKPIAEAELEALIQRITDEIMKELENAEANKPR